MKPKPLWQPRASLETLRRRAATNQRIRAFFAEREVLEVETPILSAAATVDPQIDSHTTSTGRWLQTSPEFAMKRLLASGSGPIYQLARAFRVEENGRHHNPEFTLLEWYRPGFDHHRLMDEVAALVMTLIDASGNQPAMNGMSEIGRRTYCEVFQMHAGVDPHCAPVSELIEALRANMPAVPEAPDPLGGDEACVRDFWLDLLMSHRVGPQLGLQAPVFVYDFPASQAALSRIRCEDPPVAERFELFWRGIELANGFHELADADEQRRRFEADRSRRKREGRMAPPFDAYLIEALQHGLPECAGVALGVDRLLMLMHDLPTVADTLAFDDERA